MTNTNYNDFKGKTPYASELYGVYQPLIGWKSKFGQQRVKNSFNENVKVFVEQLFRKGYFQKKDYSLAKTINLGNFTKPSPHPVSPGSPVEFIKSIWGNSSFVSDYIKPALISAIQKKIRAPTNEEWKSILDNSTVEKYYSDVTSTISKIAPQQSVKYGDSKPHAFIANLTPNKTSVSQPSEKNAPRMTMPSSSQNNDNTINQLLQELAVIDAIRWFAAVSPSILTSLFIRSDLLVDMTKITNSLDPFTTFPNDVSSAIISPIGLIHLYREYFFEFDTFLGPPVGHVWISPGGTVELIEVSSRRTLTERIVESSIDTTQQSESTVSQQDDLADAVSVQNQEDTKLGVTASGGGQWGVYHAEANANFNLGSSQSSAKETTHKQMRQQSEKLSSEIRRSFKTTFRTQTETQDTSSRRYLVQNTTDKLVNYELRRKMRKVGVQVQDLGTQLCWQVYVDEPGRELGIAELVHVAKPDDTGSTPPPPNAPAQLDPQNTQITFEFSYAPNGTDSATGNTFNYGDDGGGHKINWTQLITCPIPKAGYYLAGANVVSWEGSKAGGNAPTNIDTYCELHQELGPNVFKFNLNQVNFKDQPSIKFTVNLTWNPPDQSAENAQYQKDLADYTTQQQNTTKKILVDSVRERIKLVSKIVARPSDDLREEEKSIVYQRIIQLLLQVGNDKNTHHITAEMVRSIFDVDKMLYFVAQDWWKPKSHVVQQVGSTLTDDNLVGWGGIGTTGVDRDSYYVTEDSDSAKMGSSLGWLLQLDGDDRRNAFLNSPWVKAVLPIRPGMELVALSWLQQAHVEGSDGLDSRDPQTHKTLKEDITDLATVIARNNKNMQNVLATEKVFENGFDPLAGGFNASSAQYDIFDQWFEVLPTDQVAALEYDANAHT